MKTGVCVKFRSFKVNRILPLEYPVSFINHLRANPTKWSNALKQLVSKLPMNCLSVFDHFVGLTLNELRIMDVFNSFKSDGVVTTVSNNGLKILKISHELKSVWWKLLLAVKIRSRSGQLR